MERSWERKSLRERRRAWLSAWMSKDGATSWFDTWQSSIGGRVAEFRRTVHAAVARMSRGDGAVGAIGLQVERDVQEMVNEFGRGLMQDAFEIADTKSPGAPARGQARGSTYPWGNEAPAAQLCWNHGGTCAVGDFPAGDAPGGIHDLAGNVEEWTSSIYPSRAPGADSRVSRGGGWSSGVQGFMRASLRVPVGSSVRSYNQGFRCARSRDR